MFYVRPSLYSFSVNIFTEKSFRAGRGYGYSCRNKEFAPDPVGLGTVRSLGVFVFVVGAPVALVAPGLVSCVTTGVVVCDESRLL